jgi:hypothetical protein
MATMILVDRPFSDLELAESPSLDLRNVAPSAWQRILYACRAHDLRLYHITLKSLEGIERLEKTKELTLEWATKIDSIAPAFRLKHLTRLSVFDFPKLRLIAGIEGMTELTDVSLSGSRGAVDPPLRLATIEPVSRIPNLISFSLANARLEDDDITSLARCAQLRHLHLSNQFDRSQFAYLASRLNAQLETPITSHTEASLLCKHCDSKQVMFAGRRMPFLCRACDRPKFEKLVGEFEALVRGA